MPIKHAYYFRNLQTIFDNQRNIQSTFSRKKQGNLNIIFP